MGSGTSLVLAGGRATMPPIGFDVVCGNSRQRGCQGWRTTVKRTSCGDPAPRRRLSTSIA